MNDKPLFTRLTQIEPSEVRAALVSFLFIFMLMASYFIMKPVRDALPSDWGSVSTAQQWTITFLVSTVAVSIYNFLSARFSPQAIVPAVFAFFAATFFLIFCAYKIGVSDTSLGRMFLKWGITNGFLGKVFYVWSSVFSLFHVSVFWSFLSQIYKKEESKRIFSFINTGASAGAIFGPSLLLLFPIGNKVEYILLITSVVLLATLPLIRLLNKEATKAGKQDLSQVKLSPNPFKGFKEFITHKRLLGIAAFIFVFTGISAFLYGIQLDWLADYSEEQRTRILSVVELVTNSLTILIGFFFTNRLVRRFGLPVSLGIVPFVLAILLIALSFNPAIFLFFAFQVIRRAGNYAVTRPSREILFTAVDKEARFRTKPIIDVAVYRGGDVFWIWIVAFCSDKLGFGVTGLLLATAFVCLLLATIGFVLGRNHARESVTEESGEEVTVPG
ncbi:NTP/NDP exchange transporter [Haloferula chungangensis]|uniref:NTP/NDP exchange transporter n=1 Tax=Haloferula chungangensis TaxID=1048331 RepID=A0ABW2L8L5_9BACT